MSEHDVVDKTPQPVTEASLLADLNELGLADGLVVLVHSSLSSLGWVCGGPVAVVSALQRAVGETGTLVMPTHSTELSDPQHWENPPVPQSWWQTIRDTMPAFHPRRTPTRCMGAIVELFRQGPRVLRSRHPSHSFAAQGPLAERITGEHRLEDAFGEASPLAQLFDVDAYVLLLGVDHDTNTTLHLAERRALGEQQRRIRAGAPMLVDGARRWVTYNEPDVSSDDFAALGADFERQPDVVQRGKVGNADARLFRVQDIVEFAIPWIQQRRGLEDRVDG